MEYMFIEELQGSSGSTNTLKNLYIHVVCHSSFT